MAATELEARLDPAAEGKLIEEVDVFTLAPIDARDPAPNALNVLHVSSQRFVIERELLLRAGDHYRKLLADESARNLRALPQLSLVMCESFTGSAPDRVRLVVITKDVWSLYVDFDVGAGSASASRLVLEPKETNFLGTHQTIMGRYALDPDTRGIGAAYVDPRLFGQWLFTFADANVVLNRHDGKTEGSYGTFAVVQPFRTNRSEWSWFGAGSWRYDLARQYQGPHVQRDPQTNIDYRWFRDEGQLQAAVTRSIGWAWKNDVALTFSFSRQAYRLPLVTNADGAVATAADRATFQAANMPRNDARIGPGVEWHAYRSDFLRTLDVDTLGLQEDFRLGHDVVVGLAPMWESEPGRASGGTQADAAPSFLSLHAAVQETLPLSDGFLRASASWQSDSTLQRTLNGSVTLSSFLATPRVPVGRLVGAVWMITRYANQLNARTRLGGTDRLRGFEENEQQGPNAMAMNVEYRSTPLELFELQLGTVLFWDYGVAYSVEHAFLPGSSVGGGLRLVVPQIERSVFRLDVGVPITTRRAPSWYFAFGQAFDSKPVTAVAPPAPP